MFDISIDCFIPTLDMTCTADLEGMEIFIDAFLETKWTHACTSPLQHIKKDTVVWYACLRLAQVNDVGEVWKTTDGIL